MHAAISAAEQERNSVYSSSPQSRPSHADVGVGGCRIDSPTDSSSSGSSSSSSSEEEDDKKEEEEEEDSEEDAGDLGIRRRFLPRLHDE